MSGVSAALAEAGAEISPGLIGLLGAVGFGEISVGRRAVVGLVATGSELCEAGQSLAPGQIYEKHHARATGDASGWPRKSLLSFRDTLEATRTALKQRFARATSW